MLIIYQLCYYFDVMKLSKKHLRFVVSIILIGILIWKTNLTASIYVLSQANLVWIAIGVLSIFGNVIVSAIRIRYILKIYDKAKSVKYLSKLYLAGNFYNNFLPTQMGGDFYKAYKLSTDIKDMGVGTFAIFLDRFSGLVILFLLSLVGLFLKFGTTGIIVAIAIFALVMFGFFLGLKLFAEKLSIVGKFKKAFDVFMSQKKAALYVFGTAALVQVFAITTLVSAFYAVGAYIPFADAVLYFPALIIFVSLIPSVNGIGVQEWAYLFFFGSTIGATEVVAASLLLHLMRFGTSLVGGLVIVIPDKEFHPEDYSKLVEKSQESKKKP